MLSEKDYGDKIRTLVRRKIKEAPTLDDRQYLHNVFNFMYSFAITDKQNKWSFADVFDFFLSEDLELDNLEEMELRNYIEKQRKATCGVLEKLQ